MASILPIKGRWRAQVRRVGQRSIARTFDAKRDAERWARALEHQVDRGRAVGGARTRVGALLAEYREARRDGGRPIGRHSNTHYMLERLAGWFGATPL
jgi:hypothetical protein